MIQDIYPSKLDNRIKRQLQHSQADKANINYRLENVVLPDISKEDEVFQLSFEIDI